MEENLPCRFSGFVPGGRLHFMLTFCMLAFFLRAMGTEHAVIPARSCEHALMVETDRDVYVAGEMVFFRVFSVRENASAPNRELMNIVLHKGGNEAMAEFTAAPAASVFSGAFALHDTLQTGWYEIKAFTNAMRGGDYGCMGRATLYVANRFDRIIAGIQQDAAREDTEGDENPVPVSPSKSSGIVIEPGQSHYLQRQRVDVHLQLQHEKYREAVIGVSVVPEGAFFNDLPQWEQGSAPQSKDFPPEHNALVVSGRLEASLPGLSVAGRRLLLSTPDSIINLVYAQSDANGIFHFSLNEYYAGRKVYLQVFEPQQPAGAFQVFPLSRYTLSGIEELSPRAFGRGARDYVLQAQQGIRIARAFEIAPHAVWKESACNGFLPRLYSRPDYRIYPADFQELDDFGEISRELIYGLRVRRQAGIPQLRMLDLRNDPRYFDRSPQVFVNGVRVQDTEALMGLNSEDISHIELLNRRWALGDLGFDGVLSVFLAEGKEFPWSRGSRVMELPAFMPAAIAAMPRYDSPIVDDIPDFRQLLLWEPELHFTEASTIDLSFYTSDLDGDYRIRVSAFLPDGSIEYFYRTFRVEPSPVK